LGQKEAGEQQVNQGKKIKKELLAVPLHKSSKGKGKKDPPVPSKKMSKGTKFPGSLGTFHRGGKQKEESTRSVPLR